MSEQDANALLHQASFIDAVIERLAQRRQARLVSRDIADELLQVLDKLAPLPQGTADPLTTDCTQGSATRFWCPAEFVCDPAPFSCNAPATNGCTGTFACDGNWDEYDCSDYGIFDCPVFTCPGGVGVDFNCNTTFDFMCGAEFDCPEDFVCDSGHVFACTDTNQCGDDFTCQTSTPATCTPPGGTGAYNAGGGNTTPGDFLCGWEGAGAEEFDCSHDFFCNATSDFLCEGAADFDCGGGGWTDDFHCDNTTNFDCQDDFECVGDFECQGGTTGFSCTNQVGCTPASCYN